MQKLIEPSAISGTIKIPSSKSVVQRAIVIALLSKGRSVISNVSFCDDVSNAVKIARSLGAEVHISNDTIIIESCGFSEIKIKEGTVINCGESALLFRMFSAISVLFKTNIVLTAEKTLMNRSTAMVEKSLKDLGVTCLAKDNRPPLTVCGPIKRKALTIDASSTSQFLTGLLIALSATNQKSEIKVVDLSSKPYIDITIELLKRSGIAINNNGYKEFSIPASILKPVSIVAEGDWSGAAFFGVAGAIAGSITMTGLNMNSTQGDIAIMTYLKKAGAKVTESGNSITVKKEKLTAFEADCNDTPDLFLPLAALAVHCEGKTMIRGVNRLANKESDRAMALINEFEKLGIDIKISGNDMIITGGKIKGSTVFSYNDHRIAMALTVASLNSESSVCLTSAECVAKSLPGFFEMLSSSGGKIS